MLLRSSSTPVIGSLLPSFSISPNNNNNNHHHQSEKHGKIPCTNGGVPHSFRKSMFHSPSPAETKSSSGFRRVQSEGNLEELANASYNIDEFTLSNSKKPARTSCCTLEAIPSFSLHHLGTRFEDDDSDNEDDSEAEEYDEELLQVGDISNPMSMKNLVSEHVRSNVNYYGSLRYEDEGRMYLATGLGVSSINFVDGGSAGGGGGGGGGGSYRAVAFDRDGGDISMEEYYKRMLEENPGNALFLRNYAQFLYLIKRDLEGAEEYYSRAILADPKDGEILSQYAKLIWELHNDKKRAANYFERAVQASSQDSHIHAAYASFLWDTEDDEDEENAAENFLAGQQLFRHGFMASATA